MTKPFHAGRAAESGVVAAEFAALGFTATPIVLEAARGFFRAAGGGYSAEAIAGKLGNPWTFVFPGVSIKPHPSGSLTHPGMSVMLDLIQRHDIKPERVRRVKVGTNRNMPNALIHHRPTNELQAKFSMEFCMAILLLERKAGLDEFTDEVVNRPDVQAMIEQVDFGVHPEAEAAGYDKMTTIVDVELNDGRRSEGAPDFGKGSPANPMTDDELADKFRECAAWGGLASRRAQKDRRSRLEHRRARRRARSSSPTAARAERKLPARRVIMFEGFAPTDIDVSGARIHLRLGGSGPPLLLLHGYPLTHVMWHKIAPRLARSSPSSPPTSAATATARSPRAARTTPGIRFARWRTTRSRR